MKDKKKLEVSPAINTLLGESVVDRIFHTIVMEGSKRYDTFWDIPYKSENLGNYFSEFKINIKWQSFLDPIVYSQPFKFNPVTLRKEYFPERDFIGRTEIYLSQDLENIIVKYPLPLNYDTTKRCRYIVINMPFVSVSNLLDVLGKVEDNLDLFTQDVIQLSYSSLKELLKIQD